MGQLAGAVRTHVIDGPGAGSDRIELWNGSGLGLTLLSGRCLDISAAQYQGKSLCYRSGTGDLGPAFYEPLGSGWLRGFYGGLLVTCGLTFVGHPETDPLEENLELGLHGRISFAPARQVSVDAAWDEDEQYTVRVTGKMREVVVFGTNLELTRTITMRLGEPSFAIHDRVENLSRNTRSPLMVVYHTNPGFPILAEGSRLLLQTVRSREWLEGREVAPDAYSRVGPPAGKPRDDVFIHDPATDGDGWVQAALVNDRLGDGLGLYWRYPKKDLPVLNQWQHFEAGTYVTGIEPGNCSVLGRKANRDAGTLEYLGPGETRDFHLEMGVLDGREAIRWFESALRSPA
jgi:hypothetical protein